MESTNCSWTSITTSSASHKPLTLTFCPVPTASFHSPPTQMDGLTRPCKGLPGSAQPCVCTGTSSAPWPSSCSNGLDEVWLTAVFCSSAWGISAPLLYTKEEAEICPDMDTIVVLVRDHLIGHEGVCRSSFTAGGHLKCSVT